LLFSLIGTHFTHCSCSAVDRCTIPVSQARSRL